MKKTLLLIIFGIFLGTAVVLAASKNFSDVSSGEWYAEAVTNLAEKGIISGYSNGTFRPKNNVNRAELAVMMDRLLTYVETEGLLGAGGMLGQFQGGLGKPLGTIVEIEGQYAEAMSKEEKDRLTFEVTKVDGKSLKDAVRMPISPFAWVSIQEKSPGETARYIGYETGIFDGIPEEAFDFMPIVATRSYALYHEFRIAKEVE